MGVRRTQYDLVSVYVEFKRGLFASNLSQAFVIDMGLRIVLPLDIAMAVLCRIFNFADCQGVFTRTPSTMSNTVPLASPNIRGRAYLAANAEGWNTV